MILGRKFFPTFYVCMYLFTREEIKKKREKKNHHFSRRKSILMVIRQEFYGYYLVSQAALRRIFRLIF